MAELPLTSGEIRRLRELLALQPGDYLSAEALIAFLEARQIVTDVAERLALGLDDAGDD